MTTGHSQIQLNQAYPTHNVIKHSKVKERVFSKLWDKRNKKQMKESHDCTLFSSILIEEWNEMFIAPKAII